MPSASDPCVTTIVLPFRSFGVLNPLDTFASQAVWLAKVATLNETCSRRCLLLAVPPHSISIVPFWISGIRLDELTGVSFI